MVDKKVISIEDLIDDYVFSDEQLNEAERWYE